MLEPTLCASLHPARGFLDGMMKMAKRVQGALPGVGLLSRLASAEGGFDEMAYPEFSRSMYSVSTPGFREGLLELEAKHGKVGVAHRTTSPAWSFPHHTP